MKVAFHRLLRRLLCVAALWTLTGCNTVSTRVLPYVGTPHFPATSPEAVEILHAQPTRENIRLGEVVLSPEDGVSKEKIEAVLRKKTAGLGADAAVVVHDKLENTGTRVWGPYWAPEVAVVSSRVIVAIAIKYK
jgi:hypothetical protein